jgi:LacI family transcriptional regulator
MSLRDLRERISIKDVARAAGTSISTVSRALNDHPDVSEETRDRILAIAQAQGYQRNVLAHSLISGRSGLISVIMPDIHYDYQLQFLRGMTHAARRLDQELLLTVKDTAADTVEACRSMYQRGITDGAVVFQPPLEGAAEFLELQKAGFPLVAFHPPQPIRGLTSVEPMDYEGGLLAVRHLLALGHRRIGIIVEDIQRTAGQERLRGYQDALRHAGVPLDPQLLKVVPILQPQRSGRAAIRQWMESGIDFTAVFCFNDLVAYGAIEEAAAHGRQVPEDISIVGFDDIPTSPHFGWRGLTTIRQPITRIGELALETLLQLCDGKAEPGQRILVPVELIVRGTTAALGEPGRADPLLAEAVPAG